MNSPCFFEPQRTTGVYSKPLGNLLEGQFEVELGSPAQALNRLGGPGCKGALERLADVISTRFSEE